MSVEKPTSWCKGRFAMVPAAWLEKNLSGRQLKVLVAISSFATAEGLAWPSMTTLTAKTGIHERDLRRVLKSLLEVGFVEIEARPGTTNIYKLAAYDLETPF